MDILLASPALAIKLEHLLDLGSIRMIESEGLVVKRDVNGVALPLRLAGEGWGGGAAA